MARRRTGLSARYCRDEALVLSEYTTVMLQRSGCSQYGAVAGSDRESGEERDCADSERPRHPSWLAGVGKIAAAVNASTRLPHLLDLIARTACDLTGYEGSGVLLSDDDRRKLVISGVHGLSPDYVAAVNDRHTIALGSGPPADGPSSRAFVTQQPVPISDIQSDPSFEPWAHEATRHGYRAIVAIPMLVRGEAVGTLNCYRRVVHEFGSDELALLATLANQAASALQSTRLIASLTEQRRLLEQAEEIHRELTALALRAGGVQGVADALARLLSRPVAVADRNGAVVARAAVGDAGVGDPLPVEADLGSTGIADVPGAGLLSAPVMLGEEVIARGLPGDDDGLSELDRRAVEHAAIVCALEFLRRRTATDVEWRLRGDPLTDLLAGIDAESVAARAVPLGHDLTSPHTVVVAAPDDDPDAVRHVLGVAQTVADRCDPRPLVTTSGGHVVLLWPDPGRGPAAHDAADLIRTSARRVLDGRTVTAVVGHRRDRVDQLRPAVRTARGALDLGRLRSRDRTIALPELGVYGLLLQLDDPHELRRFTELTLDPLREHDDRRNAELVRTVRTYLDNGMNVARTATELYVHPNTVGLRLKRVEELTGLSMQNAEALLQLTVALMADDVLGSTDTS
ncbi:sugar diacid utilization regulator [Pseudonocardia sediminis]|uniref:Sugar diacid utilization regulator n=2 Tax=Pseudonocardia sediminis TaxID=1397368 RepID=A0A4Q7UYX4_PSEST|nr:sugar diacid utilization regulator [Pseudonocardia sediminis]